MISGVVGFVGISSLAGIIAAVPSIALGVAIGVAALGASIACTSWWLRRIQSLAQRVGSTLRRPEDLEDLKALARLERSMTIGLYALGIIILFVPPIPVFVTRASELGIAIAFSTSFLGFAAWMLTGRALARRGKEAFRRLSSVEVEAQSEA